LLGSLLTALEAEKQRSDDLLRNILPVGVIARLDRGDRVIADEIPSATVVFSDFVGFTPIAAGMTASDLVAALNELYSAFDRAAQRIGMEKIKTIGDAYLAVSGLDGEPAHADQAAGFALAIQDIVVNTPIAGRPWGMRVGMHSGPLTAGVIGTHKFAYDIWGDTVNAASRVQGAANSGEVLVSAATRARLSGTFRVVDDRDVSLKGLGENRVYRIDRR
jgi:class 3 adenylate cyclase